MDENVFFLNNYWLSGNPAGWGRDIPAVAMDSIDEWSGEKIK